jgi:hypothetical protein
MWTAAGLRHKKLIVSLYGAVPKNIIISLKNQFGVDVFVRGYHESA